MHLVFSVGELQVDGGSRAEQAVGFGLYIISDRHDANVEPLNELHRNQNTGIILIGTHHTLSMHAFIGGYVYV